MRVRALVVAAGLLWPVSVFSQELYGAFRSGNDLYQKCIDQAGDMFGQGYCAGYMVGAADAFTYDGILCLPPGVTEGQLEEVVLTYVRAHSEARHYAGSSIVRRVLEVAFPCKK
jgi:Rap1a immunity proteins